MRKYNRLPNSGSFEKGNIPWNKNTKGIMTSNSGSFKKGKKPLNKKPIGSLTIRKDGKGGVRRWIKIKIPNIWRHYAVFLWIKNFGPVPYNHVIHHKDRNQLNDKIINLQCISRKDHINIHRKDNKGNRNLFPAPEVIR